MKKFLSLVLALVMTMSLVTVSAGAKDFTDDDKITYEEAVAVVSEIGVVDGYADGKFNPTNTLTRQAAAKIICNLILGPTTAAELHADTAPYKDVPVTSEFAGYIAYCAKEGIISGYADGTFKPGNSLTGYAFMKMLLGALGYDQETEGYVGGNWSINVAKRALGIGLNAGLEGDFNGVKAVNREEACLYAFNTLQATMVEYSEKTTVNVGGAQVTLSGNAQDVEWGTATLNDGNIDKDGFVQFAEKYFSKLKKTDDTDDFERPANTWTYNKTEIGTYVDWSLLVAEYTKSVSGKTVYELLGATAIKNNDLLVYRDGADTSAEAANAKEKMVRTNTNAVNGSGNGVLTQIFLDNDAEEITIASINTWLAQATADYSEKTESITLKVFDNLNAAGDKTTSTSKKVVLEDVPAIEGLEKDEYVLVNMTEKDRDALEVVIVNDVEILSDSTITKFSKDAEDDKDAYEEDATAIFKSVTTGGTAYSAAKKAYYDAEVLNQYNDDLLTNKTYNVYLDQYGYAIGVDLYSGTSQYVFITGYDRPKSAISIKTATANAIFLDGTMENITVNVTDTNDNIDTVNEKNNTTFREWAANTVACNTWYTYTVKNDVYTLSPAVRQFASNYNNGDVIKCDRVVMKDVNASTNRAYGNDYSVYLTVEAGNVDYSGGVNHLDKDAIVEVTGVFTGVQDVELEFDDSIQQAIEHDAYTLYDSDRYVIGSVVLAEATGSASNYAYILSGALSEELIDDTYYWTFDAIVGGEIKTLTIKSAFKKTITELDIDTVMELRYDGEYVVKVLPAEVDISSVTQEIQDGDKVYDVPVRLVATNVIVLDGRTLYTQAEKDNGLTLVSDAKAVLEQRENGKWVTREYDSVDAAIDAMGDAMEDEEGFQFTGRIVAILNAQGVAEWVYLRSDTPVTTATGGSAADVDTYTVTITPVLNLGLGVTDELAPIVVKLSKGDLVDGKWTISAPDAADDPALAGYTAVATSKQLTYVKGTYDYALSFTYTPSAEA